MKYRVTLIFFCSDSVSLGVKGGTGKSTDVHNHFEVRVKGNLITNTLDFINKDLPNDKKYTVKKLIEEKIILLDNNKSTKEILKLDDAESFKKLKEYSLLNIDPVFFLNKIQPLLRK